MQNPLATPPHHPDLLRQIIVSNLARAAAARRELGTRSLLSFTTLLAPEYEVGWVHREITDLLDAFIEAVERKLAPRLIIQLPPRIGKSEIVSRKFPAYALGKHPEWEIVCATYNQDLANDFGRDVRVVFRDPLYAELFPDAKIREDSNAIDDMKLEARGSYKAVGIGGALTGRGAHILVIDDPVKNREDADSELIREHTWKWYQTVGRTRLAPGGGIILCQTRWHEEDLAGKILLQEKVNPAGDRWHVYSYPAIATEDEPNRKAGEALHPERWPLHEYEKLRATLDPREWSALYQQNPTPPEGIAFKRDWFRYEVPPKNLNWYLTTDFAIGEKETNDYTVIWPFAVDDQDTIFFGVPIRARLGSMEITEKICDTLYANPTLQMAIENVHISKTLGPYLRKRMQERNLYTEAWGYTASRDKLARSASLRGRLQQGKVRFHPLTKNLIEEEFIPFPAGRHDDAVDAASVGMLMLDAIMRAPGAPPPPAEGPPKWSMEWMQQRIKSTDSERKHVPRHLNGSERKQTKKASTWQS